MSRNLTNSSTEKKSINKNIKIEKTEDTEKSLKRKRVRSESKGTPQFNDSNIQSNQNSSSHQKSKRRIRGEKSEEIKNKIQNNNFEFDNYEIDQEIEENKDINFESLSKKNLSFGKFLEKVQHDHSKYKNVIQNPNPSNQQGDLEVNLENQNNIEENKSEANQNFPNANLLSFSKDFALQKAFREEAIRLSTLEQNAGLINEYNINTSNPNDLAKKLNYEPEENLIEDQHLDHFEQSEIIAQEQINYQNQSANKLNVSSSVSKIFSPIPLKTIKSSQLPSASPSTLYFQNSNSRYPSNFVNQVTASKTENIKSLPGSTKNIKEVINRIDISTKISSSTNLSEVKYPTNNYNRSISASNLKQEILNQSSRPVRRNSELSSNKAVLVILKQPNVSDFVELEPSVNNSFVKNFKNMPVVNSLLKAYTYRDYAVIALYFIIGIGLILVTYSLYQNGQIENIWKNLLDFYNSLDIKVQYFVLGLIFSFLSLLVYKKFSDKSYFKRIAQEDYMKLDSLISDNHSYEPEPIGILENKFVSDLSKSHNMTEGKYRKNVLPLIESIIKEEKKIESKEILIQEQGVKVWDYIN
jgi:hypothetical protein